MKNQLKNKYGSYRAVVAVCDAESAVWQGLIAFKTAVTDLKGCVTRIEQLAPVLAQRRTGLTQDKQRVREQLADVVVETAAAARVFAVRQNNAELAQKLRVSRSRLLAGRDTDSVQLSQVVLDATKPRVAEMADEGVTAQDIALMETLLTEYREKLTQPREARIQAQTARAQLVAEFAKADAILTERMDPLVPKLRKLSPGFAQNYLNARVIVDTRATRKAEETAAPVTPA